MAYSSVSISGYNANPPEDDGTAASSNEIAWSKHKDKLGDPLKTAIESINTNVGTAIVAAEARTPVGTIIMWSGSTNPTGYFICDGSAISQSTYSDLFTVIGTTYGDPGGGDFNIPNMLGRVPAGKEVSASLLTTGGSGIDGGTLGATGGDQNKTVAQANLPAVNFSNSLSVGTALNNATFIMRSQGATVGAGAGSAGVSGASGLTTLETLALTSGAVTGTVSSGGSGTVLPVAQPTIVINFAIKW